MLLLAEIPFVSLAAPRSRLDYAYQGVKVDCQETLPVSIKFFAEFLDVIAGPVFTGREAPALSTGFSW